MFDPQEIIVGLEMGTSKICAVVAEIQSNGGVNVIGVGQAKSRSVRKGEVLEATVVSEDVRHAISEAEASADVEVRSMYLSVTGGHIKGFNNRGVHPLVNPHEAIVEEDVQDVVKNAKAINLPGENHVIHGIRQHFTVDHQGGITNPVGMFGSRMTVDVHVVHGMVNRLRNSIQVIRGLQLEVDEIVYSGLATALAVLTNEQKELGSLVIDMGAGTTEYAVYANGIIMHTGVLAVGGDHVTNDLSYGLKLSLSKAEKTKLAHGAVQTELGSSGGSIEMESEHGLNALTINRDHLLRIVTMRVEEILQLIENDLDERGLLGYLRGGVFLAGGVSRTPGITQLAESIFRVPAHVAQVGTMNGGLSTLNQPEFATALGLVKFGSFQARRRFRSTPRESIWRGGFGKIFRRS